MNHQMPPITRQAKTVHTTPKVAARPLLEDLMEAILDIGVEDEEGEEVVEVDVEDEDDTSPASKAVYLDYYFLFFLRLFFHGCWKMLNGRYIHQGIHDCKRLTSPH